MPFLKKLCNLGVYHASNKNYIKPETGLDKSIEIFIIFQINSPARESKVVT
jgi:hypothetical protein